MKKFLVITVLALFLALPVMAATYSDFSANGDITVEGVYFTLNGASSTAHNLVIKSGSEAQSWSFDSGTFTVTNASSTSFKIYSANSAVKAIKIASTSYTSCTDNDPTGTTPATIASSTVDSTIITVSLAAVDNALTYNNNCGAATCASDYTLSGSDAEAICVRNYGGVNPGGGGSTTYCTSVTYGAWQTACTGGWQYRNVTSQSPSNCTLTAAQENDKKKACTAVATTTPATPAEPATPATPGETPATPATPASAAQQIQNIVAEAATMAGRNVAQVLAAVGAMQDAKAEAASQAKYTNSLVAGLKDVTAETKSAITNFITYGTLTTLKLGAGERAGVINSYKAAFGKVPSTEAEWSDAIKIGNGRWPTARSAATEAKAALEFKKVYKRTPNMQQVNDNAAVTVISYGLRPGNRNLNSEKAAIKSFKAIYGHNPVSALAWDIVRAIAYSGATR